ncbi:uncharacterized protein LOC130135193 [Syzygium oleosum]|uniref:uncharacterized protein LOC130135193 n=1 Tax=Syzygium oleosum TaxID=219896 RepID=UPI0024BBAE27|nr:uncharacterized protein LOC130135193 [Syzygium oleosum]
MAKPSIMSSRVLLENGHVPGTSLGSRGQGIKEPLQVSKWRKRTCLDYHGGDVSGRDNHGGRSNFGDRGNHEGRSGRGGQINHGGQGGNEDRGDYGDLATRGGCGGRGNLFGLGKGQKGLLLPKLKEIFPGPPKLLQEEEVVLGLVDLFEGEIACAILEDEEAKPSATTANPFEYICESDLLDENSSGSDDDKDDCDRKSIERDWIRHEESKPLTTEPTITINLGDSENVREIKIGAGISEIKARRMVDLLKEYQNVFAWSYADIPGLDREIVEHALPTDPSIPPKKQRLGRTKPELSKKIEEEVMKLLKVDFIEVSHYTDWTANVVPVMKKDGRVRVCIDYRDLNRASLKDDFPLPHIDVLVDSTAGFELFSFMDGFSGYNQIQMKEEDKSKTSFIIPWGTFCYKVMPFGLKNAGAIYHKAMVNLFHDMMYKEVEVYVDDMIAKSKHGEDHIEVLRKLFDRLRRFKLRLNPTKCVFGAKSRKLLGFMVSSRGIEIDSSKVKAICDLKPPSTIKEVQSLLGRLNHVARFISQLSETAKPFFKLLKKNAKVKWDTDCQKAFEEIKQYISHLPVLVPPVPRVPLILYLTIHDESLGALLAQKRPSDNKECAIYYLSKKFTSSEINYPRVEKTCVALLAKWQVLVSEFDVNSMAQKSVKGRAIADMLAENVESSEDHDQSNPIEERISEIVSDKWTMYFDGAVNPAGSGTGAVLISPTGQHHPVAAKLVFLCTNNISEYEARILGLQLAVDMKVRNLQVYGDSTLIILQTEGQWRTHDTKLIPYHEFLESLIIEFEEISFEYLPRSQNQFADALATLSSMLQVMEGLDIEPLKIEILTRPAYCSAIADEPDEKLWYQDIMNYLQKGEYPPGSELADRKYIRKLASKFFINGNALYKRSFDSILLKCVDAKESNQLMREIYEGECGTCSGFRSVT